MSEEIDINDISADIPEKIEGDDVDWEAEATKYHRIAKSRGKKIGQIEKDFTSYKEKNPESKEPLPQDKKQQPNEDLLKTISEKFDKQALKIAGILDQERIELALKFKERTGMEMDEVLSDEIFLAKSEKILRDKANATASANFKGGGGTKEVDSQKFKDEKRFPTSEEIPDRKERTKVIKELMKSTRSGGKTYWNE